MNKIKLILAVLSVMAGVVGFYYLRDSATVIRVLVLLLSIVLAIVIAWYTDQGRQFYVFSKESVEETRKVVWPNRKETMQTAAVVFAFVVAMAIFLWLVDAGLMAIVRYVMDQEG
ncbi:MAG TPA: preprotein translocase subunit SecE [Nitrosomonas nitrosa]|uniref:Protein translocase subunit SecE n=1 Tax=Nitrosomonas nitrosa TaxID=52442 RepID=A0A1I4UHV3_9PROT|nr:preprotein translocase subunit SecE [Nitrosomonas nitrosa]MCW5599709.1 preprotein translocase subunit SecE [Nitrosomonas sp.]MCO6434587.1 preprotein translocase subunit SecE [Nitrosomonas nitrosa]PTQ88972.1 protein translocase subunit secE/sec61 gamma [Nitrosomonas nitrosa]SFM88574.1 protein translocase subunit secE/sec61 gamma [Nitrosomonas nitrosa]HBZ29094.1 preprotein translocase subunit SecE [Nitrosomonas nitrosa]